MTTLDRLMTPQDLATVLGSMREGVQIIDRSWRYVFLNDAAVAHSRTNKDALLGRTMMECYPGIQETALFDVMQSAMQERESASLRNDFGYPDGSRRCFELRIHPCDPGIMILSIDVTESVQLQEQLLHAQKMEAVGRLAGGVAHDFNNLLSVIIGHSAILLSEPEQTEAIQDDLEAIRTAGERGAELTGQLLAFSRRNVVAPRVLDLSEAVSRSERMLRRLIGESVTLSTSLPAGLPNVKLDPGQLEQMVVNLVINARDAISERGKITIETTAVTLDETYSATHLGADSGPYVMLAVSDDGHGMDRETQSQVFEPFFTTKGMGKGTGLGLSTVFGIVRQSGGTIWVYSEPGKGTTFKLYFPQTDDVDTGAHVLADPVELDGTETILIIEDQEEVRHVAALALTRYGYDVLSVGTADAALSVCEHHPSTIHLVLTDVVMPRMSGPELAQQLLELRPELRVLYMSGYTDDAVVHHGLIEAGAEYLQKPLEPVSLARRVRAVLDSPTAPPPA